MDPVDELLQDEAPDQARSVAVIDAPGLVEHASRLSDDVRVWCDDWRDAQQVAPALRATPPDLAAVDLALGRLPKSLSALDEQLAAIQGNEDLTYLGGARIKHLNRSMNDTIAGYFEDVSASLGRKKCRVLRGSQPTPLRHRRTWPATRHDDSLDLVIAAHGATFGGTKVDRGTRLLLDHLDVQGTEVLDLGCGNGTIAAVLARRGHETQARDVSWSAVESTAATARANCLAVDVTWGDGLTGYADASLDSIVTNPPFHQGVAKESADTLAMISDAARVLRPGGELWCVYNSHLPWRRELEARLGRTVLVAQDPRFTVTRTTRGAPR